MNNLNISNYHFNENNDRVNENIDSLNRNTDSLEENPDRFNETPDQCFPPNDRWFLSDTISTWSQYIQFSLKWSLKKTPLVSKKASSFSEKHFSFKKNTDCLRETTD